MSGWMETVLHGSSSVRREAPSPLCEAGPLENTASSPGPSNRTASQHPYISGNHSQPASIRDTIVVAHPSGTVPSARAPTTGGSREGAEHGSGLPSAAAGPYIEIAAELQQLRQQNRALRSRNDSVDRVLDAQTVFLRATTNMIRQISDGEVVCDLTPQMRDLVLRIEEEIHVRLTEPVSQPQARHLLPSSPRTAGGRLSRRSSKRLTSRGPSSSTGQHRDIKGKGVDRRTARDVARERLEKQRRIQAYEREIDALLSELEYDSCSHELRFREASQSNINVCDDTDRGIPGRRSQPARRAASWKPINAPLANHEDNDDRDQQQSPAPDGSDPDYQPWSDDDLDAIDEAGDDADDEAAESSAGPSTRKATAPAMASASQASSSRRPAIATSTNATATQPRPRYSIPRQTGERFARGPPDRPFKYIRMPRTVEGIYGQYKHGSDGNYAIEMLEREYGTGWRGGDNLTVKYGSNYVGTRKKIVRYVEGLAARRGWTVLEACRRLDKHVDKRIQLLFGAINKGQDPFVVIPLR